MAGTLLRREDGLLHDAVRLRRTDATDGLSGALLLGEQPPRGGRLQRRVVRAVRGGPVRAAQLRPAGMVAHPNRGVGCDPATKSLAPDDPASGCSLGHFLSLHGSAADFAFADGSVRFLPYSAADLLLALATRAGGETVGPD